MRQEGDKHKQANDDVMLVERTCATEVSWRAAFEVHKIKISEKFRLFVFFI